MPDDALPLTADAERLLADAVGEADRLRHEFVGTEHVAFALLRRSDGVAAEALRRLGLDAGQAAATLTGAVAGGAAEIAPGTPRPHTSRTQTALQMAADFARTLGRPAVGPEHVLLGVLGERRGAGAQVLAHHGATLDGALAEVRRLTADDSPTPATPAPMPDPSIPQDLAGLLDRERVIARVTALFLATDRKDWPAVEACFAPEVRFDMSSAGGAPAATVPARQIADGWREGLAAVEHLHHQAGNFVVRVDGDGAEAYCYGVAYHFRARRDGRNTRVFVGGYDFALARAGDPAAWRITAMRFALKFLDGNPSLEAPE